MSRMIAISVLGLIWLATTPSSFGQTSPSQSRDRRLDEALAGITQLQRIIKDQDRRIADLEKTVKALQIATSPGRAAAEERMRAIAKLRVPRWLDPLAWSQITEGMSRAQVEEILGKPVSVEAVMDHQTLIYRGDPPGATAMTGTVKLTDDRVTQVTPPAF